MTLKQIRETVDKTLSKYDFKDIEKDRIFVLVARDRKPNVTMKDLEEFGINSNNFSVHYKKAKILCRNNSEYNRAVQEVLTKYDNIPIVDSKSISGMIDKVREFRKAFELKIKDKPSLITKSEYDLHYKLLKEEMNEYFDACEEGDKVEVLDAQVDILYILLGSVLHHGMDKVFEKAFNEVHASNMSKLQDGEVLKREDGKVLKGDKYFKPNLEDLV